MILKIKKQGLVVNIPGVAPFRTPAEVDISNCKIHLVVLSLKNNGIDDFEIYSKEKKQTYKKKDFEGRKTTDVEGRLNRIEKMIGKLNDKSDGKKENPEEQITNKLNLLEELSKKILEKENVREIVYTSTKDSDKGPDIEELNDAFIPSIDISEMKLKGSSSEIIGTLDDIDEAANALSKLKK
jgi:hypothetical protein